MDAYPDQGPNYWSVKQRGDVFHAHDQYGRTGIPHPTYEAAQAHADANNERIDTERQAKSMASRFLDDAAGVFGFHDEEHRLTAAENEHTVGMLNHYGTTEHHTIHPSGWVGTYRGGRYMDVSHPETGLVDTLPVSDGMTLPYPSTLAVRLDKWLAEGRGDDHINAVRGERRARGEHW
jgi:hypothetical protein